MFHQTQQDRSNYLGIFLISFSILILEITLTKIFSVTLWYHFSFLVISLAMFGLGFGGLLVYQLKDSFKTHISKNLYTLSIALAICMLITLKAALIYHLPNTIDGQVILSFLGIYLLCTAPFVLSSMILCILFLNWPQRSGSIYGADLLGAAFGCIGCVVLISYFSAPQVILIACLCCILAAMVFHLQQIRLYSLLLIGCFIALIVFSNSLFQVVQTKRYSELAFAKLYEKWSPLSRITVFPEKSTPLEKSIRPFGWGMSKMQKPTPNFKQLWVEQDSSAGTPIVSFDGDYAKVDFLKYDITALPYYLRKKANVFILGVGGGRDVLTALVFKNKQITGVDIHPVMIDLVRNRFADYAGHIYKNNNVHIFNAEGRSFLAKSNRTFDIIQVPLIDSWSATVAGAFAMTENTLYTTEAFATYIKHLSPQGLLSVTRFYYTPENQTIKTALLARTALESLGIRTPGKNMAIIKNVGPRTSVATILVKRTPFSTVEINTIKKITKDLAFGIVYLPSDPLNEPLFEEALTTNNLGQFVEDYYYDIRPTSDNRPFFFQMFYPSKINDLLSNKGITGQVFNYYGVAVLYFLLIISSILVLLFYITPFMFANKPAKPSLLWGIYFIMLGLGFMFIEIPFVQIGSVYLESPIYGLSVSLFGLLFFGGMGSIYSARFQLNKSVTLLLSCLAIVAIIAATLPFDFDFLMNHTYGNSWSQKIMLFILLLLPTATCMGIALPTGIRLVQTQCAGNIPWFWALNGAASVLGSIIAMAISVSFGYNIALFLGVGAYVLAFVVIIALTTEAVRTVGKSRHPLRGLRATRFE